MIESAKLLPIKNIATADSKTASGSGSSATDLSQQFGTFLENEMNKINAQQTNVDQLNEQFVTGQLSDVHQLPIASEKLQLQLMLTVQVRNKVIEAYQEIMRTQI